MPPRSSSTNTRGKLRKVRAVARGYGHDSVFFECGHVCSLVPFKPHWKPYPRTRFCFNCGRENPQTPRTLEVFLADKGRRDHVEVLDDPA